MSWGSINPVALVVVVLTSACTAGASGAAGVDESAARSVSAEVSAESSTDGSRPGSGPDVDPVVARTAEPGSEAATTATEPDSPIDASDGSSRRSRTEGVGTTGRPRLSPDGSPIFPGDFADPFLVVADGVFTAYATNTLLANVPTLQAGPDGGGYVGDSLPDLPAWTEPGRVWAPSVLRVGDGYVMYYTSREVASRRQCIGVATASGVTGPFVDSRTEPFICDLAGGGSIDASPFVDLDGAPWLLWKSDGNCCGLATRINVQRLTADGTGLIGEPVQLIRDDLAWEDGVVEGPTMVAGGGGYHLFYSAGRWDTEDYSIGHAVCESVTGPCEKDGGPWLASYGRATGPGGQEVVAAP
ncbi:MAG: family 43 glycosylhydrolase, partial [Acidimicrobiales bacterium]